MASPFSKIFLAPQKGAPDGFPQLPTGDDSVYYAAHNPVIVSMQREDRQILATADDGSGFVKITLDSGYTVDNYNLTVGGLVYVKTALITGLFTVTGLPDLTHVVINLGFTGPETAGFINFVTDVKNFFFTIRLTSGNNTFYSKEIPDSTGLAHANISRLIRKTFKPSEFGFETLELINLKDIFLSSRCAVDYKLDFDGAATDYFPPYQDIIYGCNSALQPDDSNFNNMIRFVPEPTGVYTAKFLSQFGDKTSATVFSAIPKAIMWRDLPFDLQFIYSDILADAPSKLRRAVTYYKQGNIVAAGVRYLNLTDANYINRLKLDHDTAINGQFDYDLSGWTQSNFTWSTGWATTTNALATLEQTFAVFPYQLPVTVKFRIQQCTGFTCKIDILDAPGGSVIATQFAGPSIGPILGSLSATGAHLKISLLGGPGTFRLDWVKIILHDIDKVNAFVEAETAGPVVNQATENKLVEIRETPCNPVYLKWLGYYGSWNYWCFSYRQQKGLDTKNGELFSRYLEQFELPVTDNEMLSKDATPTLSCGAEGLTNDNVDGLCSLLASPKVLMLMNPLTWGPQEAALWVTVQLADGSFKTRDTRMSQHRMEIKLTEPKMNLQSL